MRPPRSEGDEILRTNKHIEIVTAANPGLSSMGKTSRTAIRAVLARHYRDVRITIINDIDDLEQLAARQPDLVFLGMKYLPFGTDKLWISDYLDRQGIAYTGSGQAAHHLELNKSRAKQRALEAGLRTAKFYVVRQGEQAAPEDHQLEFPVFIKPANRGGGQGVDSQSLAYTQQALRAKVESIRERLGADSLVEEYLPGREFSVAILRDGESSGYSAMPIELVAPPDQNGDRLLSAAVKSADAESFMAITEPGLKQRVNELALDVFRALGARDYGRIDIRLDRQGSPHFLEANLIPSLISGYGSFPKACLLNSGLSHEAMLLSIVGLAMGRGEATITDRPPILMPALAV